MGYNRWALSERAKCFFFDNQWKVVLSVLALILAVQYPEYARPVFGWARSVLVAVISYSSDHQEFLFGAGLTVFLNYAKDNFRLWQEVRAIGRALRHEVGGLGVRARFHLEEFRKLDHGEGDYEARLDNLRFGLRTKSKYLVPARLFHGTDYMPFFESGTQKVALLRVRYLVQGDDVVRLSSVIHQFINEYETIFSGLESEYQRVADALAEENDIFRGRDLARCYWLARDDYARRVEHFIQNCKELADVLRKY